VGFCAALHICCKVNRALLMNFTPLVARALCAGDRSYKTGPRKAKLGFALPFLRLGPFVGATINVARWPPNQTLT
jgi:hypothetical protein